MRWEINSSEVQGTKLSAAASSFEAGAGLGEFRDGTGFAVRFREVQGDRLRRLIGGPGVLGPPGLVFYPYLTGVPCQPASFFAQ